MRLAHVLTAALTVAGLVAPATGALAAQADSGTGRARRLERPDDEPDRLIRIVMNRKARLGIKVNLQARDTDSLGAYVESVSPNGPAAKAGLRSGDVITKLDGQSVLTGGEADEDADTRQSLPGLRLIELAARLQPADTVPIEFLRGKGRKTVSVITEKEPDSFAEMPGGERPFTMRFLRPGTDRDRMPLPAADLMDIGPGDRFEFLAGSPWATSSWRRLIRIWASISAPPTVSWSSGPRRRAPWGSREGTWCRPWTAGNRPGQPTFCASCGATIGAKASSWTSCATGSGRRSPPVWANATASVRRLTDVLAERHYMFGPPWRGLWDFCGP